MFISFFVSLGLNKGYFAMLLIRCIMVGLDCNQAFDG